MKCLVPEISWHNREPVLSIDIHPINDQFYKLATGGADCHVLIWQLKICENGAVDKEVLSDLTRHQRAVNAVKWAPNGRYLATGDDDANIIIWQLKTDNVPLLEEVNDKEIWIIKKVMRGHKEDIYDLAWSPNSLKLISGSIDNTAIIWDITKFQSEQILTDHKGFVQGVGWDPKGYYIATISTDRVLRIFDNSFKNVRARISKGTLPVPENNCFYNKEVKYFHDDTFKSYFRRLDFSPDGSLLAVPSGRIENDEDNILNCTLIFAVENWNSPVAVLPLGKQLSTVVRFCPILFELHEDGPDSIVSLPYRMIFAVGTNYDIVLYDTQQVAPFAYFHNIHYTRLTDLTWSPDGQLLIASSTDGFCSLITFEPEELGKEYIKEDSDVENSVLNISGVKELDESITEEESIKVEKSKKPTLIEKWAIKTPNKGSASCSSQNETSKTIIDDCSVTDNNTIKEIKEKQKSDKEEKSVELGNKDENKADPKVNNCEINTNDIVQKTPKRIVPIKIKLTDKPPITPSTGIKRLTPIPVIEEKKPNVKEQKQTPSLQRKRPLETPPSKKNGTLLNFVKTVAKNKVARSINPVIVEEAEAQDAWDNQGKEEVDLSEDSIDNFTLQLEETNSQVDINSEYIKEKVSIEISQAKESDKINNEKSESIANKNPEENIKKKEENIVVNNCLEKPKKRVPLITLSSPKQKIKK